MNQLLDDGTIEGKAKVFHKGQNIFKTGQPSNAAYLIKSGRVSLYKVVNNKRIGLETLGVGRIFGEMGVISGERRSSEAEALEYTEVLVLDAPMLHTLLLKSPRPVQIITSYLMHRVKLLSSLVSDRPSGNLFLGFCQILALMQRAANQPGKPAEHLSLAEVSRTVKEVLLISQLEIDEIVKKLEKLRLVETREVKAAYYRKDPLLGEVKKSSDYVKDRLIRVIEVDKFLEVARNVSRDAGNSEPFTCELEFIDLPDLCSEIGANPEIVLKKIAYSEIPETMFFFHKPSILAYAEQKGPEFFLSAKKPRLKPEDLQTVEDITGVDNATLQEAFSQLGFYKISLLAKFAGSASREKIFHNLSRKIAKVVKEELENREQWDEAEAADAEHELINIIKSLKGL